MTDGLNETCGPVNNRAFFLAEISMEPLLRVDNLSKQFPGVKALDHMSFDLYPGEVHILAGENGAGKSTLSKCILGYIRPDQGSIYLDGQMMEFSSPGDALKCGIASVYQELTMIPWLNAAQNIYFHREPVIGKTGILRRKKMIRDAEKLLAVLGSEDIDVTVPVCRLGVARQQMIEIAKVLSMNPKIIIFDEPTASLSEKEVDSLFDKILELKRKGLGIIYISHRMQEYGRIGDRVTVMRDGKYIGTKAMKDVEEPELVRMMIGHNLDQLYVRSRVRQGEEALRIEHVNDKEGKVRDCSFCAYRGEILGLAGLVGSGRTELAELIFGIRRLKSGHVYLHGKDVSGKSPRTMVDEGLGLLPENRKELGLALRASVAWNVTSVNLAALFPNHQISRKEEREVASRYIKELDVAVPGMDTKAVSLSGGNQQKVVIAKWLCANTDVVIFDEPTRGIDVGAKMEIYRLMDQMSSEGKTVIMISSEVPELLGMCDRICVMREGSISGELKREEFSTLRLGEEMFSDGGIRK